MSHVIMLLPSIVYFVDSYVMLSYAMLVMLYNAVFYLFNLRGEEYDS